MRKKGLTKGRGEKGHGSFLLHIYWSLSRDKFIKLLVDQKKKKRRGNGLTLKLIKLPSYLYERFEFFVFCYKYTYTYKYAIFKFVLNKEDRFFFFGN